MPGWYYRLQWVRALLLVRLSQIWPDLVFRRNITNPAISEPVEQYFLSYGLFEARNLLRPQLQNGLWGELYMVEQHYLVRVFLTYIRINPEQILKIVAFLGLGI